ncbi:MAG: pentapeptide repeat-containing protein [Actinoallomurus sp.]
MLAPQKSLSWWWVWSAVVGGVTAGGGVTVLLWLTKWTGHKDALDVGMKITLAIVGLLGVILAVHRHKLSEAEHRRQLRADKSHQAHSDALLQRQLEADKAAREDAIARQITDLSSKASEQLGSDKAAVRIGGLTDLERLAQAYPELRQTVIDRICAYLRAPFEYRNLLWFKDQPSLEDHEKRELKELTLELDVRHTAQQILTNHLFWPVEELGMPNSFWSGIGVDLRGATLVDFDLSFCRLSLVIDRAEFYGRAALEGAILESASFESCKFVDVAHFQGVEFEGYVGFRDAIFEGPCEFQRSKSEFSALFNSTRFKSKLDFSGCIFGEINFSSAKFDGKVEFNASAFAGAAIFDLATFNDDAWYASARFQSGQFIDAKFEKTAQFHASRFKNALFSGTTFGGAVEFTEASFENSPDFEGVHIVGDSFQKWPDGWLAVPYQDSPGERFLIRVAS